MGGRGVFPRVGGGGFHGWRFSMVGGFPRAGGVFSRWILATVFFTGRPNGLLIPGATVGYGLLPVLLLITPTGLPPEKTGGELRPRQP